MVSIGIYWNLFLDKERQVHFNVILKDKIKWYFSNDDQKYFLNISKVIMSFATEIASITNEINVLNLLMGRRYVVLNLIGKN